MRRYDLRKANGEIQERMSEEDIRVLFGLREVTETTPCRISGNREWHTVNDHLPLLKYEAAPTLNARSKLLDEDAKLSRLDRDDRGRPAKTTALTAGWICFGLGVAIAWIFPPAHIFYSVAIILAIVCMCTHQVPRGLVLLISSCVGVGISAFISMAMVATAAVAVATPIVEKLNETVKNAQIQSAAQQQALARPNQTLKQAFTPPPPSSPSISTPATPPIEHWSAKQLLEEITRLEELQRASRKANREVPAGTVEKLLRAQALYDQKSR